MKTQFWLATTTMSVAEVVDLYGESIHSVVQAGMQSLETFPNFIVTEASEQTVLLDPYDPTFASEAKQVRRDMVTFQIEIDDDFTGATAKESIRKSMVAICQEIARPYVTNLDLDGHDFQVVWSGSVDKQAALASIFYTLHFFSGWVAHKDKQRDCADGDK